MPRGSYNVELGEYSLLSVSELPFDAEIQAFVDAFIELDDDARNAARVLISQDEMYELIQYAKRKAVMALNDKRPETCEQGLLALAVIDENRVDMRDVAWAAGLLAYSARSLNANASKLYRRAGSISTNSVATALRQRSSGSLISEWGYARVELSDSVGLIKSDNQEYRPTSDLTGIAIDLAESIGNGRYVFEPKIATEIPVVWFPDSDKPNTTVVLERILGAVQLNGRMKRDIADTADQQMLLIWVAELPSRSDSERLAGLFGQGVAKDDRVVVAIAEGPLFSLAVAGSYVVGTEAVETLDTLNVLIEPVRRRLATTNSTSI